MRLRKDDKKNLAIGFLVGGVVAMFLPAKFNPFAMVRDQFQNFGGSN